MDINTTEGTKVTVTKDSIKNGYDSVETHARKHLEIGGSYTIDYVHIEGWNTDVFIKEMPDIKFNSVSFENLE